MCITTGYRLIRLKTEDIGVPIPMIETLGMVDKTLKDTFRRKGINHSQIGLTASYWSTFDLRSSIKERSDIGN